eukprot:1040097-Alexandrium_andersonii.AAC.1
MQGQNDGPEDAEWTETWSAFYQRRLWVRRIVGPDGVVTFTNEWNDPYAAPPAAQEPADAP